MKISLLALLCALTLLPSIPASSSLPTAVTDPGLVLWYEQPAKIPMNEALAIGNGSMGGLVFGDPARERVSINEDSLWTGDENPSGDYGHMGAYQVFGNLFVNFTGHEKATGYRRDLDIGCALSHVSYEVGGVKYRREYFCSHPAGVLVAKFTADKPGSHAGSVELDDSHKAQTVAVGNRLTVSGTLENGLKYEWQVLALHDGGSLQASGTGLEFKGCDSITLFLVAGTDYAMDFAKHYRDEAPHSRLTAVLDAASHRNYEDLMAEHEKDFQSIFNRVSVDFGKSTAAQTALPTDKRRLDAAKVADPELERLVFEYGRYLLISCSRPGGLPANLQGLWNDNNNPAWHCDYHANINIQMNYWPAEVANMGECHLPLFDLLRSQLEPWRKATAVSPDFKTSSGSMTARGWAVRTSHNIMGGLGWKWDKTANAWYCQHLWEHYAFGLDKAWLREVAYPIMKETCEFWEDHLKTLPDGRMVVPNGWSPEHGPTEDGVSYSQEIIWDLFNNYVDACNALGIDRDYQAKIAAMRDKLAAPGIGSWGQLLEWMTEKKDKGELDTPNDHHRHTSHLFAVFPGRQIGTTITPKLAGAAKVSLEARGDKGDVREWSYAWRTALYARLRDSEAAHRQVMKFFGTTCPNLFGNHPPMQMDGNFGITAGIAEMLVQSHEGEINLLPALPAAWPAGSVRGLRTRGGFEIDLEWKEGRLASATVHGVAGNAAKIRYGDKVKELQTGPGQTVHLNGSLEVMTNDGAKQ